MQLTPEQVNALIGQNRRIQVYPPNCDCGNEATLQQPDIFGGTTGYCQSCYDALGGEGE